MKRTLLSILCLTCFSVLFGQQTYKRHHSQPFSPDVIAENSIKSIEITYLSGETGPTIHKKRKDRKRKQVDNDILFHFDEKGRLLMAETDDENFTRYEYDDQGRLAEVLWQVGGNGREVTTYQAWGNEGIYARTVSGDKVTLESWGQNGRLVEQIRRYSSGFDSTTYRWDEPTQTSITRRYKDGKLFSEEEMRWEMVDGKPETVTVERNFYDNDPLNELKGTWQLDAEGKALPNEGVNPPYREMKYADFQYPFEWPELAAQYAPNPDGSLPERTERTEHEKFIGGAVWNTQTFEYFYFEN